jgi:hypothetical protein
VSPGKSCTLHTCFLLISNVGEPDDHTERKLRLELEKTSTDRSEEQKIRVMIGRESKRCNHSILRIISVNLNSSIMKSGVPLLIHSSGQAEEDRAVSNTPRVSDPHMSSGG